MLRRLKNYLTKHLFCTVLPSEIITILQDEKGKNKLVYLNNEQIADLEWKSLSEEVKCFEKMRIYSILMNTLGEQARQRMFEKSKCDADMLFGKAILLTLDTQRQIMGVLKQFKPR